MRSLNQEILDLGRSMYDEASGWNDMERDKDGFKVEKQPHCTFQRIIAEPQSEQKRQSSGKIHPADTQPFIFITQFVLVFQNQGHKRRHHRQQKEQNG